MQLNSILEQYLDHAKLAECLGVRSEIVGGFSPDSVFGWANLNEILSSTRLTPPRLRFAHQDLSGDELNSFYTETSARRGISIPHIDEDAVNNLLTRGATLVLDAVDEYDPNLREIVRSFARTFFSIPQVNLYACFGADPGFGVHWDDHDVFIFQLDGRKHWKIFPPTRASPCYKDVESPPALSADQEPYLDKLIEPGEILYVPRGHWHDVLGINEPTLHLTLGITHPTATDLLVWLSEDLKTHSEIRRDLPLFDKQAQDEIARTIIGILSEQFDEDIICKYLDYRASMLRPKLELSLPVSVIKEIHESDKVICTAVVPPRKQEDGSVTITARGSATTFSKPVGIVFDVLQENPAIDFRTLREKCSEHVANELVERIIFLLLDKGVVAIRR